MTHLLQYLRGQLHAFLAARDGNVAVFFTLALLPMIGFVGMAVDYSRGNSTKVAIQAALDATALMLSKDASSLTNDQLKQKAQDIFNSLFTRPEAKNITLNTTLTSPQAGSYKLVMTASANVDATFSKVLGQDKMNVGTSSEVVWGIKRLELALALDNTGSMQSSSKMTNLKKAAHSLLDTLKKAAKKDGDVKVAIIPFDTTVNIGTSYKDAFWVDYSVENIKKSNWEGCVEDRDQPNDTLDTAPVSGTSSTYFPAADCGSLAKAMPLSYDWTALNNKIDEMSPNGNTNVTIGLVWAWHALTSNLPFTEGATPVPDLDKVIIILTDGDNTQNRWSSKESTINKRTETVCANIKTANIKIYSIRVIDGNADLLKKCATNPSMYYDVQQASQLNNVFSAIAQNLANLRIAK